jgi:putative ABC transport system permease protein
LLKPLPYSDPDRIVRVWQAAPALGFAQLGMSEAQFVRLREGNQSFQEIGCYTFGRANLSDQDETQRIVVSRVTAGVFAALDIQPILGRAFRQEEESPSGQEVAVLSYGLWQRRFGEDANVLGQARSVSTIPRLQLSE